MLPFTDEELKPAVSRILEKVRPMLALDGGDVTLLDIRNGKVFVQLTGACHGCPSSSETLKYGIENKLKTEIHPELQIVNVPLGQEVNQEIG